MKSDMKVSSISKNRLIGLQANTSKKSSDELDKLTHLDIEDPKPFSASMIKLYDIFGTRILGGCCGTNNLHIEAIAKKIHDRLHL
jgi:methionine synthase I (cobalamin-dependent)